MLFFREKNNQKSTENRPKIDEKSTNIVKKYQKNVTNRFLGALLYFLSLFEGLGAILGGLGARIGGSVAVLDANMAEKSDKRADKVVSVNVRHPLGEAK